ncbi:MAG: sugar ABC transporter substrate-binding protein [Chloroflexi bacterium]|nr:sugar ABC transporter substrate-binding protein [Chloroflexota bacterium]
MKQRKDLAVNAPLDPNQRPRSHTGAPVNSALTRRRFLRAVTATGTMVVLPLLTACGAQKTLTSVQTAQASTTQSSSAAETATKAPASAAATTPAKPPVHLVLSMWLSPEGTAMVKDDLAEFAKGHPDLRISLESLAWSAYNSKITTEIAGGAGPDVAEIPYESWIYSGFMRPLDAYLTTDKSLNLHDYYPAARNYSRYNGKIFGEGTYYGLPWRMFATAIFYNKTLFDQAHLPYPKAGWTYDEMLADARTLTHQTSNPNTTDYGLWWYIQKSQTGYDPVVWAFGGHEFDASHTHLTLSSPESLAGLQWLWNTMYLWKVMPTPELMQSGFVFASGRIGMAEMHNAFIPPYQKTLKFPWGIAPMPAGPGHVSPARTFVHTIGISKGSKQPDDSWKLLAFLVGSYAENALVKEGSLPALKAAVDLYVKQPGPPGMDTFLKELPTARMAAMFNHDHAIEKIVNDELALVWLNKESPAEAVAKITPEVNSRLAKAV